MHTIVWIPMVFAAIAAGAVVSALSRRETPRDDSDSGNAVEQLRSQALFASPGAVGIRSRAGAAWAVVMDSAYDGGCVSLVSLIDGSTSLYFQNGDGMIGAGRHAAVRSASTAFVRAADGVLEALIPATSTHHPNAGRTRFFVRTDTALLFAEALETCLGEGAHPLSELFFAGQNVITAVREETAAAGFPRPRVIDPN